MGIENALIAKIGVGLVLFGGATGGMYANKDQIIEWVTGSDKDYLFVVSVSSESGIPTVDSGKELYGKDKVKNYKCKYETIIYECDIVSEIKANQSKIIKINELKNTKIDKEIKKAKISTTSKSHFLLKIKNIEDKPIKFSDTNKFEIVENVTANHNTPKLFGKLKPILGQKDKKPIGKFQYFLAQVNGFGDASNNITFEPTNSDNCDFFSKVENAKTPTKKCEIYKFSSSDAPKTSYNELTFNGNQPTKINSSHTFNKKEYYIVKFTDSKKLETSVFEGKNLIFLESVKDNNVKKIHFSFANPFELIQVADGDGNNLIIVG